MSASIELESCFVIHTRNYQETSLLVELFCLNYGRISLIARGAKSKKSLLKSKLQPFVPLKVSMTKGRSELWYLKDCQIQGLGFNFSVPNIFCATYLNELIYYLVKNQECEIQLFASYLQALNNISNNTDIELSLRKFECELLSSLGLAIDFVDSDNNCFDDSKYYIYSLDSGFVLSNYSSEDCLSGKILNDLKQGFDNLSKEHLNTLKYITTKSLKTLLNNKEIKSRVLYANFLKNLG